MNQPVKDATGKDATVKTGHYSSLDAFKAHVLAFVSSSEICCVKAGSGAAPNNSCARSMLHTMQPDRKFSKTTRAQSTNVVARSAQLLTCASLHHRGWPAILQTAVRSTGPMMLSQKQAALISRECQLAVNAIFFLCENTARTVMLKQPARQKPTSGEKPYDATQSPHRAEHYSRTIMSLADQIRGYRLTTAEILYHMPDHPGLLQTFVWQDLDVAPRFPVLHKFLDFWSRQLDGRLHSVRVGATSLISAGEWRHTEHLQHMH